VNPGPTQPKEGNGIPFLLKKEDESEVGKLGPEACQGSFDGGTGRDRVEVYYGTGGGALSNDPIQPSPGVTMSQGILGLEEGS
jgi:hypothetical protein